MIIISERDLSHHIIVQDNLLSYNQILKTICCSVFLISLSSKDNNDIVSSFFVFNNNNPHKIMMNIYILLLLKFIH